MAEFKVGDIVRFVPQPDLVQYTTEGAIMQIKKVRYDVNAAHCALLIGEWTEARGLGAGEARMFYFRELEHVDERIQSR